MEVAAFRKIKRPGFRGCVQGYVIDRDEFGLWALVPGGSMGRWREDGAERLVPLAEELTHLRLIRDGAWWTATWWPDGNVFVDTATPVQFVEDAWSWVDLELDIRRLPDGVVLLEDEDEFDAAIAAGHINAEEERAARAAAAEVVQYLKSHAAPFDASGRGRFDAAMALGLAPLDAPPMP